MTSARPPTRAWEVARTVVAAPSSVVKCLWEVFVRGVVLVVCVCVCRCRGRCSLSVCVCVCDLLIIYLILRDLFRVSLEHPNSGVSRVEEQSLALHRSHLEPGIGAQQLADPVLLRLVLGLETLHNSEDAVAHL